MGKVQERPEAGKDLDIVCFGIDIHLHVAAAELDLRRGQATTDRRSRVRQKYVPREQVVLEDTASGANVDLDTELIDEPGCRPALRECGRAKGKDHQRRRS